MLVLWSLRLKPSMTTGANRTMLQVTTRKRTLKSNLEVFENLQKKWFGGFFYY
jgi:hypothetical protein